MQINKIGNSQGNPQLQDGYTRIANELLEAILTFPFSKREIKVILYVIRYSYGYHKKYTIDSAEKIVNIANNTEIDEADISRTIKKLESQNVLVRVNKHLALNKHYSEWKKIGKTPTKEKDGQLVKHQKGVGKTPRKNWQNTNKKLVKYQEAPLTNVDKIKPAETPKESIKEIYKENIEKENIEKEKNPKPKPTKKQILKEKIRYNESEGRFESFPEELISYFQARYPDIDVKNVLKTMESWIFTKFILKGKHSPYRDYAAALARWLAKEEQQLKNQKEVGYVKNGISRYVGITKSEKRNKQFKDEFIP